MNAKLDPVSHLEHGAQCSCILLAQMVGLDPRKLSFAYCHRVLHKHWHMTCRHGDHGTVFAATARSEHWHGFEPTDPVKAILISNHQRNR